jgi:hypothetical protein
MSWTLHEIKLMSKSVHDVLDPYNYVLPGPLPGDQNFRIHGEQSLESPWLKSSAQDSSQARSAQSTVCQNGSRTPRTGRCEVLAAKRSRREDRETIPRAIDDATRIRALQIFPKHNQTRAIQFIDYVV